MSANDRLTIEEAMVLIKSEEACIDMYGPCSLSDHTNFQEILQQLAETMRENERLKYELRIAKTLILKEVHARAVDSIEQTYKDSDNADIKD